MIIVFKGPLTTHHLADILGKYPNMPLMANVNGRDAGVVQLSIDQHAPHQSVFVIGVQPIGPCYKTIPGNGFENVMFCKKEKGHDGPCSP